MIQNHLEFSRFSIDSISAALFFTKNSNLYNKCKTVISAVFCGIKVKLDDRCCTYMDENKQTMKNTEWYCNIYKAPVGQRKINLLAFKKFYLYKTQSLSFLKHLETKKLEEQNTAATIIQKRVRGNLARQHFLPIESRTNFAKLCKEVSTNDSTEISKLPHGVADVFQPTEASEIIIKLPKPRYDYSQQRAIQPRESSRIRFHQMRNTRNILNKQQSSNLVIPKATTYYDCIVEQKLPVNWMLIENMSLYCNNPKLFDEAIREMVRLFSEVYVTDIIMEPMFPYNNIDEAGYFPKYDNIPFSIIQTSKGKQGKINLVDLETIKNGRHEKAIPTLVKLFPLHKDIILKEAKRMNFKLDYNAIKRAKEAGDAFFNIVYKKYHKWLKGKKAFAQSSKCSLEISEKRIIKLQNIVEEGILKIKNANNSMESKIPNFNLQKSKGYLTKIPNQTTQSLSKDIVNVLIKIIRSEMDEAENTIIDKRNQKYSESTRMHAGSIEKNRVDMTKQFFHLFNGIDVHDYFYADALAEYFISCITDELVKGNEIFDFNLGHYPYADNPYYFMRF